MSMGILTNRVCDCNLSFSRVIFAYMEGDFDFDKEQQAIMDKNPLLARLMDRSAVTDPGMWTKMVLEEYKPVADELYEKFGKNFFNLGMYTQIMNAQLLDVFSKDLEYTDVAGIVGIINAVGYQVEDLEDISKFRDEIVVQLALTGALDIPEDEKQATVVGDVIWGMLSTGNYWRHVAKGEVPKDDVDVPDSFKRFIDGSDLFKKPL